jgi:hypothetical protein
MTKRGKNTPDNIVTKGYWKGKDKIKHKGNKMEKKKDWNHIETIEWSYLIKIQKNKLQK